MDSLERYVKYYNEVQSGSRRNRADYLEDLVKCICSEVNVPPYDYSSSPLFLEIIKMIDMYQKGTYVYYNDVFSIVDAFFISALLIEYIKNKDVSVFKSSDIRKWQDDLFRNKTFGNNSKPAIDKIRNNIMGVIDFLNKKKNSEQSQKKNSGIIEIEGPDDVPSDNSGKKEDSDSPVTMKSPDKSEDESESKKDVGKESEAADQRNEETVKPGDTVSGKEATEQIRKKEPENISPDVVTKETEKEKIEKSDQAQLEEKKAEPVDLDKEYFSRLSDTVALRLKANEESVSKWHKDLAEMSKGLQEIQPIASDILKRIMSFQTDVTESYVLNFAKMQIRIIEFIYDLFDYHSKMSTGSGNKDYINAVRNYIAIADSLADSMSEFGIEEIKSSSGDPFDGAVHEVVGDKNFSPRNARVKESLRSGFRYKDVVIKKEKITV